MTPQELATFVREEGPRIRQRTERRLALAQDRGLSTEHFYDDRALLSALDAAVGLLREAEKALTRARSSSMTLGMLTSDTLEVLATLRLVVGEKEAL